MLMCTCIYFLIEIFIILDHDTALSEGKKAEPQSKRKQLGKIVKIVMCTSSSKMCNHSKRWPHSNICISWLHLMHLTYSYYTHY